MVKVNPALYDHDTGVLDREESGAKEAGQETHGSQEGETPAIDA